MWTQMLRNYFLLLVSLCSLSSSLAASWDTITTNNDSSSSCYYYSNKVHQQCFANPSMPTMDIDHIALCLRHNCEINRRLQQCSKINSSIHDEYESKTCKHSADPNGIIKQTRGGQVSIHPSQFWHPPIPPSLEENNGQLTIFHAENSIPGKDRQGASRWGMDIHEYVDLVTKALDVKDNSLVLALAMVYLDRASSVETSRTYNSAPPCPFLSPRTVHRLFLTSLVIAAKAVQPNLSMDSICDSLVEQNISISPQHLLDMELWMRHALGDDQLYVSDKELEHFKTNWENWERLWSKPRVRVKGVSKRLVRPTQS